MKGKKVNSEVCLIKKSSFQSKRLTDSMPNQRLTVFHFFFGFLGWSFGVDGHLGE
jgi:hypothetical protein